LKASVLTIIDTINTLKKNEFDGEKVILLVDTPKTLVQLVDAGVDIKEVNVGGMHFKPGKNQISPFIFVDEEDVASFKILFERGIVMEGRDVPTRPKLDIAEALKFID
jgi:mannose PTS system EIIAB component